MWWTSAGSKFSLYLFVWGKKSLFCLQFWNIFSHWVHKSRLTDFHFKHFKSVTLLSFVLNYFWWEVCCNSDLCSSFCIVLLFFSCLQESLLSLGFQQHAYDIQICLCYILCGVFWACCLIWFINFQNSQPLSIKIFILPTSISFPLWGYNYLYF